MLGAVKVNCSELNCSELFRKAKVSKRPRLKTHNKESEVFGILAESGSDWQSLAVTDHKRMVSTMVCGPFGGIYPYPFSGCEKRLRSLREGRIQLQWQTGSVWQ